MQRIFLSTALLYSIILGAVPPPWLPESGKSIRVETIPVSEIAPAAEFQRERSLNGIWKCSGLSTSDKPFPSNPTEEQRFAAPDFDDSKWDEIAVPLNWYRKYKQIPNTEKPYVEGWYRMKFRIKPDELKGKRAVLHFDVIGYDAKLFLNGQEIGDHHGDFTPFELDATNAVRPGENTLAIRVLSDFGPVFGMRGKATHPYGAQWGIGCIKGGIWQDVSLRFVPEWRISEIRIDPRFTEKRLDVRAAFRNPSRKAVTALLSGEVISALRKTAKASAGTLKPFEVTLKPGLTELSFSVPVPEIKPWTPDNPRLYYLTLSLERDGKTVSVAAERFGFRSFEVRNGRFFLNGEPIYLFGENLSSLEYGGWGRTAEEEEKQIEKKLLDFKNQGYVMLRTAHMPAIPAVARIADECGMLLYDEWAWSFTTLLDMEKFRTIDMAELSEFVLRDYNHPSVVMWSLGNEVIHRNNPPIGNLLDLQSETVRKLDRSKRPISVFSGSGNWHSYGDARRDTDVLDLHSYVGMSKPWTLRNPEIDELSEGWKRIYGSSLPAVIAWELVGFSWGFELNANFPVGDVLEYARYAARNFDWANPRGIGLSGSLGLAAALDPARASNYAQALYGKRILELYRLDPRFSGFAPWYQNTRLPMARLWNQKVFPALHNPAFLPPRNLFSGQKTAWMLAIVNDGAETVASPELELTLIDSAGKDVSLGVEKLPDLAPHSRMNRPLTVAIPAGTPDGAAQLRLRIKAGNGNEAGRNFYDIFLCPSEKATAKIKTVRPVWLLDTGAPKNTEAAGTFLNDCGISFLPCKKTTELDRPGLLIVPPEIVPQQINLLDDPGLSEWIQNGGILLVFEQKNPQSRFPGNVQLREAGNTFSDLVTPAHPYFSGLKTTQFDTWNNPDSGFVVSHSFRPYLINAIAVNGPMPGDRNEIDSILIDATSGSGRVVLSQFELFRSAANDSAAALLRHNLVRILAGESVLPEARPLTAMVGGNYSAVPERLEKIDLAPYANRSFSDTLENDGKGGWTDQGNNDFSTIPLGEVEAAGITFHIIDPEKNNGRSCLMLRGTERPAFPAAISNIKVSGKFSRLFFLHTSAWKRNGEAGRYRIHYADGKSCDFILCVGRNIDDWWSLNRLPEAKRGITRKNPLGAPVTAYVAEWENPRPEEPITTIDFLSPGAVNGQAIDYLPSKAPVPILIAVSGEKVNPMQWEPIGKAYLAAQGKHQFGSSVDGAVRELTRPNGKALELKFPETANEQTPAVMVQFKPAPSEDYRYLVLEATASANGIIQLEFPEKNWKSRYRATILLNGDGKPHRYRLTIGNELKCIGKDFRFGEMRNELFVFYPPQPDHNGKTPKLELTIHKMRFE